jgi:hypothetical protein
MHARQNHASVANDRTLVEQKGELWSETMERPIIDEEGISCPDQSPPCPGSFLGMVNRKFVTAQARWSEITVFTLPSLLSLSHTSTSIPQDKSMVQNSSVRFKPASGENAQISVEILVVWQYKW